MRLNKLLKYNGHFWHVGSIGMCLFLILAVVVLVLELLKGIPFLTSGIDRYEQIVFYVFLLAGILFLLGIMLPVIVENRYKDRHSFTDFLSEAKQIELLNYNQDMSFLHLLDYYITQSPNGFEVLEERICGTVQIKDGTRYGVKSEYHGLLWANRILDSLKRISEMSEAEEISKTIDKCFALDHQYKEYIDVYRRYYTDKCRRMMELAFLVLLVFSFICDGISSSEVLNALAVFLLVWDLVGLRLEKDRRD